MQLFGKSCVLYLWRERVRNERSSSGPFCQKSVRVVISLLDDLGQLPNYPSINHAYVLSTHTCSSFLSSHCSALCPEAHSCLSSLLLALPSLCCYKPLHGKSLSFLLSSVESSSSSSSFFVFFNAHSFLFLFFFKFYLSNLIWEIHLKVEFWSIKHQATLICYQKPPGTNTDLNYLFIFFTYQIFYFLFFFRSCMLCSY